VLGWMSPALGGGLLGGSLSNSRITHAARRTGTDRGAAGSDALIFKSAVTGRRRTYSYAELLERVAQFGGALLIDAHSMPSSASGLGLREHGVDVVLGDNHGEACAPLLIDVVEQWLTAQGLRVRRNQPYAGGFTTQRYGRPAVGRHTLQIEINRSLYMDEARHTRLATFSATQRLMAGLLEQIGERALEALLPRPLAAE